MTMESIKATYKDGKMTIEGEFDIEVEFSGMHPSFPPEDEELFNRSAFEIKSYGEIKLSDIPDMVKWINTKSTCKEIQRSGQNGRSLWKDCN